MTGRHRTPSDRSRILVRAGVAAAAATAPLAVSGTALAEADPERMSNWDRLASCESTNDWSADTGNGFTGGLQFTESTWREFGGEEHAESADQATRAQQIEVAQEVQKEQGWKAWPTCTKKLGMR